MLCVYCSLSVELNLCLPLFLLSPFVFRFIPRLSASTFLCACVCACVRACVCVSGRGLRHSHSEVTEEQEVTASHQRDTHAHMDPLLFLLIFVFSLPGVQNIRTVDRLSVQTGDSVFTVTLRNLQEGDTNHYWCAVEINKGDDDGAKLYLTVTERSAGLSVLNNMVGGEEGGRVSVRCRYGDSLRASVKRWCRNGDWSSCLTAGGIGTSQHASVLITDDRRGEMSVTVRVLQREDAGWYWCAAGKEMFPVHIAVTQRTATTTSTATRGLPSATHQTAAVTLGLSAQNSLIPDTTEENSNHRPPSIPSSLSKQHPLLVMLGLLLMSLLVVAVAMVTWKLCAKHEQIHTQHSDAVQTRTTLTPTTDHEDVLYSTLNFTLQNKNVQLSVDSVDTSGDDVVYSSVFSGNGWSATPDLANRGLRECKGGAASPVEGPDPPIQSLIPTASLPYGTHNA
ncbi:hypothetical protein AAFF_G00299370 [Aldrovandia affinis]|uniref:Ig-like domain-containing protein n=1 Tax=Aldrovandia affinis TaxID=143900 RepID=A0AAD7R902_9TELE|nr:hypothetical protein AAFF_G00299370 [Aldrovandia affinis]